jgi:DNA-binding response OmpR family regulator
VPLSSVSMSEEILLLDDDRATLSFLETVLASAGLTCSTAADPSEALTMVRARKQIAVIVSDIYMPGLTGLQLADQLNSLKLEWSTPAVLLLTARPSLECAVDALRLGACDFLTKPIRPTELVNAVRRALERVQRERASAANTTPDVERLIRQAEDIAGALRQFTRSTESALSTCPVAAPGGQIARTRTPVDGRWPKARTSVLDAIERLRTLRWRYEDHKLDDVAWDLLLEMLRAEQNQHRLSVSALTISIPGVSSTTSLRRISELTARGYVERVPDAHDGRRDFVRLTAKAREILTDYLTHADTCLTELQSARRTSPMRNRN